MEQLEDGQPSAAWNPPPPTETISELDQKIIEEQLGFFPRNMTRIAGRDALTDHPTALLLYPLNTAHNAYKRKQRHNIEPFPTIFWLCCPKLKQDISRLEASGLIEEFDGRLQREEDSREILATQHKKYSALRMSLLTKDDLKLVQSRGWEPRLRDSGIAGMKHFHAVKCLHTHYAHYIGTDGDNIVGEWVHERLLNFASTPKQGFVDAGQVSQEDSTAIDNYVENSSAKQAVRATRQSGQEAMTADDDHVKSAKLGSRLTDLPSHRSSQYISKPKKQKTSN